MSISLLQIAKSTKIPGMPLIADDTFGVILEFINLKSLINQISKLSRDTQKFLKCQSSKLARKMSIKILTMEDVNRIDIG